MDELIVILNRVMVYKKSGDKDNYRKCSKCITIKNLNEFPNNRCSNRGKAYICFDCNKIRMKMYYDANRDKMIANKLKWDKDNPEKVKEYQRSYRKLHGKERREIAAKLTTNFTIKDIRFLDVVTNNTCLYCRRSVKKMTLDHIIPLRCKFTTDLRNDITNLVFCCGSCNYSKGNNKLNEWLSKRNITAVQLPDHVDVEYISSCLGVEIVDRKIFGLFSV